MVEIREWLARVAMHPMPPNPTHGRRGMGGGDSPAILPLLTDAGASVPDTRGVGSRRPPNPPTSNAPEPGPPSLTAWGSLATCVDVERNRYERGNAAGPAPGHSA